MLEWVERHVPALLDQSGKHLLPDIIESEKFGTILLRMKWTTLESKDAFPDFLIGDNPLVITHGLEDSRSVVALPLSPTFLFLAAHSFDVTRALIEGAGDCLVAAMNESTVAQAEYDVFGTTERHLRFVENRLRRREIARA